MPVALRRFIFWLFVVGFLVAGPLLVLYTAGYRYNFSNGQVLRTGVLSITTSPRGVDIAIDGEAVGQRTPQVLKQITPGEYEITLSKDGYHTWSGMVDIVSGETSQLQTIQLFLDSAPDPLFQKTVEALAPSPDGELIAYATYEAGWEEVWIYNLEQNEHTLIDRTAREGAATDLQWSAQGGFLARQSSQGVVRIFARDGDEQLLDDALRAQTVSWHPSTDHLLTLDSALTLQYIDLQTQEVVVVEEAEGTSILLDASILSFVDNGSDVEVVQLIDGEKTLLALLPRSTYTIEHRDGSYLLLQNTSEELFVLDLHSEQPILLQTRAPLFDWLDDQDALVYSDGNEINIYDAQAHTTEFLTRQGETIVSVLWHPTGNSLLMLDGTGLYAFERFESAEQRFVTTLLSDIDMENVWIEKDGHRLYYLGDDAGVDGLFQLELTKPVTPLSVAF